MKRIAKYSVAVLLGALALFCLFACGEKEQLKTPCNLQMTDEVLTWNAVENAQGYHVDINGTVYETDTNSLDTFYILDKPDTYQIKVVALGYGERYCESEWSVPLQYTIYPIKAEFGGQSKQGCSIKSVDPSSAKGKVIVPTEADGREVYGIGSSAFQNCTKITGVLFPEGIKVIEGYYIFQGCTNLKRVAIPSSVIRIGYVVPFTNPFEAEEIRGFFAGHDSLTSVTVHPDNPTYYSEGNCIIRRSDQALLVGCAASEIPNGVKIIWGGAFSYCYNLENIEIPDSVTKIGEFAFRYCKSLKSVSIPDSVTSLGKSDEENDGNYISDRYIDDIFFGCANLESVYIGDSVAEIGEELFSGCHKLSNLTVSPNNPYFKSEGNCIIRKVDNTLVAGCTYSEIPEGVEHIGQYAFSGSGFSQIRLPQSLLSIGKCAFLDCSELKQIHLPQGLQSISNYAFTKTQLETVILPDSVVTIGKIAFGRGGTWITVFTSAERGKLGWFPPLYGFFECQFEGEGENQYLKTFTYIYDDSNLSPDDGRVHPSFKGFDSNARLPYRAGYTFMGWATEEDGEVVYEVTLYEDYEYYEDSFYICLTKEQRNAIPSGTVLYAVWQKNA